MSLILDALTRAEGDKRRASAGVPDLLVEPTPAPASSRVGWIALWTVLCIVLSAGGIYAWNTRQVLSRQSPETPAGSFQFRAEDRVSQAAQVAAALPEVNTDQRAAIDALYARLPKESDLQVSPVLPDTATRGPDAAERQPAQENSEAHIDVAGVLRELRQSREETQVLQDHPAPLLDTLPKRFRDSVPTLMYLRHDYASSGDSSVVINGQSLRLGQRTRNVEVREILSDSVVLSFAGTPFRLRALNSWVNL